ncbi:dUTP diphosphatase [Geobacillus thermodenitrificans]|uniref:dUTP diphosphatase n=1 Tax=Geobacillus thermodenitrificans TaxID=33940 RepID=A0ABY9Q8U2_GEOTD|nr:dUTP diphosphatase [Geobacillus thermodenitrificans]WMV75323.1 dUTP diphosphatase [Geobacillus thermodenitrificans]
MNLQKLFDMQRKLDEHIEREHPRKPDEDRLAKKILALMVELGELANEWRGFKFWSHDQVPRTRVLVNRTTDDIGFKNIGPEHIKNPLLEEYVDCLHFLLSVGLEITEPDMINLKRWNLTKADNITEQFLWLMSDVTELYNGLCNDGFSKFEYELLLLRFIHLGEMLGFTWKQIEEAYMRKNAVNHERQEMGY